LSPELPNKYHSYNVYETIETFWVLKESKTGLLFHSYSAVMLDWFPTRWQKEKSLAICGASFFILGACTVTQLTQRSQAATA